MLANKLASISTKPHSVHFVSPSKPIEESFEKIYLINVFPIGKTLSELEYIEKLFIVGFETKMPQFHFTMCERRTSAK